MVKYYRVRKNWKDAASQLGAYTVLDNAKAMAEKHEGYTVYDWNANAVYGAEVDVESDADIEFSNVDCPFMVKVDIDDLNIRKSAGTNTAKTGKYTGKGDVYKRQINGIVNGIRSCIGAVANAVTDVANTIRSHLHFSVPDEGPLTDFESWMPDFMSGLAMCIRDRCTRYRKACVRVLLLYNRNDSSERTQEDRERGFSGMPDARESSSSGWNC